MGFFDESSSGEEHDADDDKVTKAEHDALVAADDEEDPLDAYMKSLGPTATATNDDPMPQAHPKDPPTQRLDLENEDDDDDDDDTYNRDYDSNKMRSNGFVDNNDDDEIPSQSQRQAREALEQTFRKATSSSSSSSNQLSSVTHPPADTSLGNCNISPVQHCFWQGTDSERGSQWRREHQVVLLSSFLSNTNNNRHNNSATLSTGRMDPIESLDEFLVHCFQQQQQQQQQQLFPVELTRRFQKLTTVQAQTLPVALSGHDCVVTAATGQGKTLAYIWPVLVHCHHYARSCTPQGSKDALAVILVPTRELARQVHAQAVPWLQAVKLTSVAVLGGQGRWKLLQELQQTIHHVVVATPGRLIDVASNNNKRRGISLDATSMVVLDEADQLLHMGFEPQVRQILQKMSQPRRQTLLFSATLGRNVERVAREWLSPDACKIAVGRTGAASQHVQQFVHVLPHAAAKDQFVVELLPALVPVGRTLVFVATRQGCERLADLVRQAHPDLALVTLHGDKHQWDRNAAVRALVKGTASVLIASDVAARGLDLPKVQTVVSLDPAKTLDGHVHRVGRAGRLLSSKNSTSAEPQQQYGTAHTLLTPRDQAFAAVLRNAFAREGREISPELEALASSSPRHSDNTRTKGNRAGLGFAASMKDDHDDDDRGAAVGFAQRYTTSYYGPNGSLAPPAKRGR